MSWRARELGKRALGLSRGRSAMRMKAGGLPTDGAAVSFSSMTSWESWFYFMYSCFPLLFFSRKIIIQVAYIIVLSGSWTRLQVARYTTDIWWV